jgi:hypothetical protein
VKGEEGKGGEAEEEENGGGGVKLFVVVVVEKTVWELMLLDRKRGEGEELGEGAMPKCRRKPKGVLLTTEMVFFNFKERRG